MVPGLPLWYEIYLFCAFYNKTFFRENHFFFNFSRYEGTEVGKIHMVNLAIPNKVYKDVGISFQPPFGAKSFVTLEPLS